MTVFAASAAQPEGDPMNDEQDEDKGEWPNRAGRPKHAMNLRPGEIEVIHHAVKKRMAAYRDGHIKNMKHLYELAEAETGFPWKTIARVHRMMRPTTGAALDYFKAKAFKMASRVVKEGNAALLVDVLSRPNIGVLEPIKKQDGGMGGGFFMSVQSDSLGAVNIAVGAVPAAPAPPQIEEGASETRMLEEMHTIEGEIVQPHPRPASLLPRGPGHSPAFQKAVENARERLAIRKGRMERNLRKGTSKGIKKHSTTLRIDEKPEENGEV